LKIRKSIYPKTKRLSYKPAQAEITEKITKEQVDALNDLALSFIKKGEK